MQFKNNCLSFSLYFLLFYSLGYDKKNDWHILYCTTKLLFFLQSLPDKNLNDLSQVCRTFSLATLKNIFPPSSHFTKGGNTSNISPSGYVAEYIGKKKIYIQGISQQRLISNSALVSIGIDFCWYFGSYLFMREEHLCLIHQFLFFWCCAPSTGW